MDWEEKFCVTYGDQVMSRVGKVPIPLPSGVQVDIQGQNVTVKGPNGELSREVRSELAVRLNGDQIIVDRTSEQPRHRALHGLTRSLLANMVIGVTDGFSKELELQGVGYRAAVKGEDLQLSVGRMGSGGKPYVVVSPPPGISFKVEGTAKISVLGADKQQVGQVAAEVRAVRPPEPYKGKGIRYVGEYVRRKAGKAGKATTA